MGVDIDTIGRIYWVIFCLGIISALAIAFWPQPLFRGDQRSLVMGLLPAAITCFGGAGILAIQLFSLDVGKSLLAAILFMLLSVSLFGLVAQLVRRATTRQTALANLIGGLAAVVVPIEPGVVGAVTTQGPAVPLTIAAISRTHESLPVGATVVVTALTHAGAQELVEVALLPAPDHTRVEFGKPQEIVGE